MNSKDTTEEFIRRESKTELTEAQLEPEFKESKLEAEVESKLEETELESEFQEAKPKLKLEEAKLEPECKRITARTEFDAVHPRFRTAKKPEEIEEFQNANDYYCEQCKLYFAPTVLGLQTHFKGDMVKHRPIDECFYCKGPVYAYSFKKERQIYHNCEDAESEVDTRQEQIPIKDWPNT